MKPNILALALLWVCALTMLAVRSCRIVSAQAQTPASATDASSADTDSGWPRTVVNGRTTFLVYQPQIDRWEGNRLSAYAAVAVDTGSSQQYTFGVVYFNARTEVDKVNRLVTLDEFQITRVNFPTAGPAAVQYRDFLQHTADGKVRTIALDRILADLAVTHGQNTVSGYELQNTPPQIIFSTSPAVLVLIDGEPVLRIIEGLSDFQRVINTRALLLRSQKTDTYYLYLMGGWVTSQTLTGPWRLEGQPPAALNRVKDQLEANGEVDLLTDVSPENTASGANPTPVQPLTEATVPPIYISTVPAELLQIQGDPLYTPIPGTALLYVNNTGDDLFIDTAESALVITLRSTSRGMVRCTGACGHIIPGIRY